MMTTKTQLAEREQAIEDLREILHEGDVIYVTLRHVSRSGMLRALDLHVIRDDTPRRITYSVAKALGWTYSNRYDALMVDGCGMDMGFHAVYTLSAALFGHEAKGGYKLSHRWL